MGRRDAVSGKGQGVNTEKVGVIGIGNVLMGDDAVGPYIIKMLKARWEMPVRVALIDAGTAGMSLPSLMEGYHTVILVDTVQAEGGGGTVHRYDREALLAKPFAQALTPHDPGLRDALLLSELLGNGPQEAVLVGMVPECVDGGVGLSCVVRGAMDALAEAVVGELERLGVSVARREIPLDPDLWWERSP